MMWKSTLTQCPVCRQLRVKTPRTLLFAISWTCSGHWVTRAHEFVSAGYQATVALTEMKEWTNYKRDPRPRYRPTGKCPLYRYETTGQLLHSEVGSNQVGCSCTWQRSLSCETSTGTTEEVPAPNQSWRGCNHRLRIGHTKATKSHILSRGPPTGCHHCVQTLTIDHMLLECAVLQECCDEYYTVDSLNALFETIPETFIVEFLREAGFFYLIWCNLLISTSPQYWTIWSDLSNCLENQSNSETHSRV